MGCRLIVLICVLGAAGSDPGALVRRLGASKYADREAASAAIEKLGREALPALKAAKGASDAEIRSRASTLVDRIENDLMVKPTLVTLDFPNATLNQVAVKLSEIGHTNLSIPSAYRSRAISLVGNEPVPFWKAVELMARAGAIELADTTLNASPYGQPRVVPVAFLATPTGAAPPPVSVSGPFRVSLLSLNVHRERDYSGQGLTGDVRMAMGIRNGLNPQPIAGAGMGGDAPSLFNAHMLVMGEPRMNVAPNGPVRMLEAVDELGNSLLEAVPSANAFTHNSGYMGFEPQGTSTFPLTVPLKHPAHPGQIIRRLRGVVPVTVTARKDDPLLIALASAKGKTFQNAEVMVTIHDQKTDLAPPQTTIELTILGRSTDSQAGFGSNFFLKPPGSPHNPFEIVDAKGRVLTNWMAISQIPTPEGTRVTIRVPSGLLSSPATHLRYYETSRANTDAEFEFVDVRMP